MKGIALAVCTVAALGIGYSVGSLSTPKPIEEISSKQPNGSENPNHGVSVRQVERPVEATFTESLDELNQLGGRFRRSVGRFYHRGAGADLLRMEELFSLANESEMLQYFSEMDFSRESSDVLDLAYHRLGELNLQAAILIWQEQYQLSEEGLGVAGLVKAMTAQDREGVEPWIDGLSQPSLRDEALASFLNEVFTEDLDVVKRRFTEINDMWPTIELTKRLGYELEPDEFEGIAERLLGMKDAKWAYQNQLRSLLETWGEVDSGRMIGWLMSKPSSRFKNHVIPQATQMLVRKDPQGFLEGLGSELGSNEIIDDLAGQAWLAWLAKEGETELAMEWFSAHGSVLKVSFDSYVNSLGLSIDQSRRVLEGLSEMERGPVRSEMGALVLKGLIYEDPGAVLAHADEFLEPGQRRESQISQALRGLIRQGQVETALDYIMFSENPGERERAVNTVFWDLAEVDPRDALIRTRDFNDVNREQAQKAVFQSWSRNDLNDALAFLKSGADERMRELVVEQVFFRAGEESGGVEKISDALEMPQGEMRHKSIHGLFAGWTRTNAESASEALMEMAPGSVRDHAIAGFVESVRFTDREASVVWALEIGNEELRRKQVIEQAKSWLYRDKQKATAWIQSREGLSAELQEGLQDLIK